MINVLNSGKILTKLRIGKRYATFHVGVSFHPEEDSILKYVKNHPNLEIATEVTAKEEPPKEKKRKRKRKRKSVKEEPRETSSLNDQKEG